MLVVSGPTVKPLDLPGWLIACHHHPMDTTELDAATLEYRQAQEVLDRARKRLAGEVRSFLSANPQWGAQALVARRTGWSTEQVRKVKAGKAPASG